MIYISKSKFVSYKTCSKSLWLSINKPEAAEENGSDTQIKNGKLVGEYAKKYFLNTVDVTSLKEDGELDVENMIGLTNRHLLMETETIAEASFSIDGLFCSVDLLHKVKDGYEIYEVKASNDADGKDRYFLDIAFQQYVLQKRGLKIVGAYLLHLNREYRRHGEIEVDILFTIDNAFLNPDYAAFLANIDQDIKDLRTMLENNEPFVRLSSTCKECPFKKYCYKDVPCPSTLDLARSQKKYDLYYSGIVTFEDLLKNKVKLNRWQTQQVNAYLGPEKRIVNVDEIKEYFKKLTYPIYHLDFESIELPIPPCDNAWPYEQIPTQYSLHIEHEDGRVEHKEFLGETIDPRRAIAESLCNNIPMNVCVTAYHKSFECGRLNELADLFPDLSDHLRNISDHVVDLEEPFSKGMFYDVAMGGRSSIKVVLPALYPNDPELDYHSLPLVHNGGEAMDIYPKMLEANPGEKEKIRHGLLVYCCLDTLAMVKVLKKLREYIK